jgi:hypothetical protein
MLGDIDWQMNTIGCTRMLYSSGLYFHFSWRRDSCGPGRNDMDGSVRAHHQLIR